MPAFEIREPALAQLADAARQVDRAAFGSTLILSWGFIMWDLWLHFRNHGLELLRRAGRRCERRMRRHHLHCSILSLVFQIFSCDLQALPQSSVIDEDHCKSDLSA